MAVRTSTRETWKQSDNDLTHKQDMKNKEWSNYHKLNNINQEMLQMSTGFVYKFK